MLAASFWQTVWYVIIAFLLVNLVIVFFAIVFDVFRDHELGGGMKAVWIVLLLIVPIVSIVVY